MKNNLILLSLLGLLFFAACEKDSKLTDSPLSPNTNIEVEQVDTFSIVSYTIEEQALNSKTLTNVLLGNIKDSRMGNAETAIYSQFRLTTNNYELGENPILDSITLSLAIVEGYGAFDQTMDFSVYQMTEALEADEDYENDVILSTEASPIGTLTSFNYDEQDYLNIVLDNTFGQLLLDQFNTSVMENSENFLDFLNGLYIEASENTGGDGILKLDLTHENTSLNLYFHSDNTEDSLYQYVVNNQTITASQYKIDFTGTEVEPFLNDDTNEDDILFLLPFSGTRVKIEIPNLDDFSDYIINDAFISFYQADYAEAINDDYPEPERIFIYQNTSDTSVSFLPGFSLNNPTAIGGTKTFATINGMNTHEFQFDITQYVQQIAKGEIDNNGLSIAVLSHNEPDRIKLAGGNHPDFPIKMKITYTKAK